MSLVKIVCRYPEGYIETRLTTPNGGYRHAGLPIFATDPSYEIILMTTMEKRKEWFQTPNDLCYSKKAFQF